MKNKTKVALLSAAISLTALGAFGATTFAWFTQRASTQLNFNTATIKSNAPNLAITLHPIGKAIDSTSSAINISSAEETHTGNWAMADLSSSYGESFVQKTGDETYSLASDETVADSVMTFGIEVHAEEVVNASTIHFKLDWTANSSVSTTKTNVERWIRGSVLECTDDTFSTASSSKFAWLGDTSPSKKYFMEYNEDSHTFTKESYVDFTYGGKGLNKKMATYSTPTTKFFKVSFWFEGTVDDIQDIARSETVGFSVTISSELDD
ncbi:MAG: hypothetical protein IJS52_01425 [Bacilli bacterium]|nr:hypothetical protein [Bacilli bacterium]